MLHLYIYHGVTATHTAQIAREGLKAESTFKTLLAKQRSAVYLSDFAAPAHAQAKSLTEGDDPARERIGLKACRCSEG